MAHVPERRTAFSRNVLLNGFVVDIKAEIIGWVILINHYHILANVEIFSNSFQIS